MSAHPTPTSVLPEQYASRVTPVFSSPEEFRKARDDFYLQVQPELDRIAEMRRKSEEAAQTKRYR